jgi:peptidyl-dipeptidase Dcp
MMRHLVPGPNGLAAVALLALCACAFTTPARANPLLEPSTLPLGAPAFDRIQDADFAPAFTAAMSAHLAEVAAIANDPAAPTFANTLVALEKAGWQLRSVNLVFTALVGANTNDALQAVQQDIAPKLAAHRDAIFLDGKLFARVEAVYAQREGLKLDAED